MSSRETSRRAFLGTVGLALAGAARGRAPRAEEAGGAARMQIDLSLGAIGFGGSLKETLDLAVRHGFEAFDPSPEELASLAPEDLDRFREDLRGTGLVLGAAGLPVDFRGPEERFAEGMRGLPRVAAALARAGATRVGTWIGPAHRTLTYSRNFRQHVSRLREIASVLGDHGLRLGLEYVGPRTSWTRYRHPFIHTMEETKDLLAAIERKDVGFVLDSWHWYTAGETEADLLSLSGREIVAVDLNDAPAGKSAEEQVDSVRDLPCATGVIDVGTFLRALGKVGYDGPVRAEPFKAELRRLPREEAVRLTAEAMKKAFALVRADPGATKPASGEGR